MKNETEVAHKVPDVTSPLSESLNSVIATARLKARSGSRNAEKLDKGDFAGLLLGNCSFRSFDQQANEEDE